MLGGCNFPLGLTVAFGYANTFARSAKRRRLPAVNDPLSSLALRCCRAEHYPSSRSESCHRGFRRKRRYRLSNGRCPAARHLERYGLGAASHEDRHHWRGTGQIRRSVEIALFSGRPAGALASVVLPFATGPLYSRILPDISVMPPSEDLSRSGPFNCRFHGCNYDW